MNNAAMKSTRKLTIRLTPVVAIFALILAGWCAGPDGAAFAAEHSTPEVGGSTQPDGSITIPCFRCHSPERFADSAIFPHDLHREMALHCNQCHIVRAHESISLNGETCKGCHNLGVIKLAHTSMPATFNHEVHASMFACGNCHSDPFRMKTGAARIEMQAINKGKYCGKCHNGELASSPDNCAACH